EKIVEGQIDGRAKNGERREELREPGSADFPGDPSTEKDFCRAGKCGQKAQCKKRIAENGAGKIRSPRRERRMVNVAPRGMFAAGSIVELIAKKTVLPVKEKMQQCASDRKNPHPSA